MSKITHGFRPSPYIRFVRKLAELFILIFRLNSTSNRFSIEVNQQLNPISKVRTKYKDLSFYSPNGRLTWRSNILLTEEPLFNKWVSNNFNRDTVFLDLGSNVGTFACLALAKGIDFCYCCELDPLNIPILYKNLCINKFQENTIILPFAASSKTAVEEIYFRDLTYGDALQAVGKPIPFETNLTSNQHKSLNLSFPLDVVFELFNLKYPTHIKIDINGNERIAIDGMIGVLSKADSVYFEYSYKTSQDCEYCLKRFYDIGYEAIEEYEVRSTDRGTLVGKNILLQKIK